MKNLTTFAVMMALTGALFVPTPASAATPFGLDVPKIKLSDGASGWIPTYGPGENLVVEGATVHAAFTTSEDRVEQVRYVMSADGGITWGPSKKIAEGDLNGNGAHLAAGGGDVHFVWGGRQPNGSYSDGIYYASLAHTAPVLVSAELRIDSHSRSIAADGTGTVIITFMGVPDAVSTWAVMYAASSDGGATFGPPQVLWACEFGCGGPEPDVTSDGVGSFYATWTERPSAASYDDRTMVSKLSGGSWSVPVQVSGAMDSYYGTIAAQGDTVCASWYTWRVAPEGVAVACSTDGGATWAVELVEEASVGSWRPVVQIDGHNGIHVLWTNANDDVLLSRKIRGRAWIKPEVVYHQVRWGNLMGAKLAVDLAGKAYVVFPSAQWEVLYFTMER